MPRKNSRKRSRYSSRCENLAKARANKKCVGSKTTPSPEVDGKLSKKRRFRAPPGKIERIQETRNCKTVENYYPDVRPRGLKGGYIKKMRRLRQLKNAKEKNRLKNEAIKQHKRAQTQKRQRIKREIAKETLTKLQNVCL